MTDKQMPERIWAQRRPMSRNQIYQHKYGSWHEDKDDGICVEYIRADLCEKTIEDKSASSLSLETLVEELGDALRFYSNPRNYALAYPLPSGSEVEADVGEKARNALSKLDAWRAGS